VRARWSPQIVLCWHSDLLTLLPLIRDAQRRMLFLHGIEVWDTPGWLKQRLYSGLDLVLSNSTFTLARAREAAPVLARVRGLVVPLGTGECCVETPPPEDPPAAVMLGRLDRGERYKGHGPVLDAWSRVLERIPNAQLWIIGEGDLRAELEDSVRVLALADHVTFFGRVEEARKDDLITRARCLLLPSRAEGFGIVYAEAMRLGRPSLVGITDAGREVVNPPEASLAADPADPQARARRSFDCSRRAPSGMPGAGAPASATPALHRRSLPDPTRPCALAAMSRALRVLHVIPSVGPQRADQCRAGDHGARTG
jgi:glycosyltransferase involved in cell wall biosynthesis